MVAAAVVVVAAAATAGNFNATVKAPSDAVVVIDERTRKRSYTCKQRCAAATVTSTAAVAEERINVVRRLCYC